MNRLLFGFSPYNKSPLCAVLRKRGKLKIYIYSTPISSPINRDRNDIVSPTTLKGVVGWILMYMRAGWLQKKRFDVGKWHQKYVNKQVRAARLKHRGPIYTRYTVDIHSSPVLPTPKRYLFSRINRSSEKKCDFFYV